VIDANRLDVLGLFVQPVDQESCIAHTIMCYLDDINTDKQLRDFQQHFWAGHHDPDKPSPQGLAP
jgi:hypothetical protein